MLVAAELESRNNAMNIKESKAIKVIETRRFLFRSCGLKGLFLCSIGAKRIIGTINTDNAIRAGMLVYISGNRLTHKTLNTYVPVVIR